MILIAKSIHQEERNTISWQSNWWFQPMLVKFDHFPRVKIKKWNHHLYSYSKLKRIFTKTWVTPSWGVEKAPGHPAAFRQPSLFLLVPGFQPHRADMLQKRHFSQAYTGLDRCVLNWCLFCGKNDWMSRKHVQFKHHYQPQGLGWWINTDSLHCTIFHINPQILKTNSTGLPPSIENKTSLENRSKKFGLNNPLRNYPLAVWINWLLHLLGKLFRSPSNLGPFLLQLLIFALGEERQSEGERIGSWSLRMDMLI